jgi:hypothetical protein
MGTDSRVLTSSPPLVALAGWLVPGAGYFLIGQRGRALGVGITIIVLFIAGLLIAGVRVIEVPGFDVATGEKRMLPVMVMGTNPRTHAPQLEQGYDPATHEPLERWILAENPLGEIRDKPWSVPQALAGPIAIVSAVWSVDAASIDPDTAKKNPDTGKPVRHTGTAYGAVTHARINEIGSLYLSVAGLLNLMVIIDSTWRASHISVQRSESEAAA